MDEKPSLPIFELLIKFLKYVVYENTHQEHLRKHIDDLEQIMTKIKNNDAKLTDINAPEIFSDIVRIIIAWNPKIEPQLYLFWEAYLDIIQKSNDIKISLRPLELFSERVEKLIQAQLIFEKIFIESKTISSDKLFYYSMFYFHTINTISLGDTLINQFKKLLDVFDLQNKYDIEAIFSTVSKIKRGDKFETDVRAVRNALAHLNYKIKYLENYSVIKFSMTDFGYNFHRSFTQKEFKEFVENSYYLYDSQLALLFTIIALGETRKFFGNQFPMRYDSI